MTFSREFLAEFHAGVHPDDPQLLAHIYADEGAVAYLDALESVTDLLRQYGRFRAVTQHEPQVNLPVGPP